ncbi:DHA2 family efflux MFS transporter permease subunit [Nocardia sp. alder85J]|uniref:DHA2 family efflux MFS transporter permease subunit n=1 Tax=Nocardia sp. alder85J TaxID=2862949 RepID=UPI001CD5997F|nr:DHA2 family efflux MFS transporter permease subunit [Nocardia sp. alder85J]MCX4096193.1 DHA2 family efflux MFS transporter permease subunit [Nocardia sp. alder85J]
MTPRQRWTLALTSVASLMVGLDALVVATALNTIRTRLHASMAELEWTVNAYSLAFAVLLLTAAVIGDRLGRRRTLAAGLTVFTLASAACALAPGIGFLIAARAVQGAGSAMVMPAAMALIGAAFEPRQRGAAMGIFGGITGLAILGGPVLGGAIVQGAAWQWIFWLNVPIGALLIPAVLRRVAESHGPIAEPDLPGLLLSGAGVLAVVWGLVRAGEIGWGATETIFTLVGGGLLLALFAGWELRTPAPMVPMRIFADRVFSSANLASLLQTASIFGTAFFFAQYLQAGLHEGPLDSGLRLLPWTATLFVVAPIAGARINRIGERPLIVAGLLGQALGFGWIALAAGSGYAALIAPMVLAGVGVSVAMPAAQSAVLGAVAPQAIGTASGLYNTGRQLGGALGIAVVSAVFAANGSYASPAAVTDGFRAAIAVSAALSAAGALAGLAARRRITVAPRVNSVSAPAPDVTTV